MRVRCTLIGPRAGEERIIVSLSRESGRIGVSFPVAAGSGRSRGAGCIVELEDDVAITLEAAVAAHPRACDLRLEKIEPASALPLVRLTIPGEDRDKMILEMPAPPPIIGDTNEERAACVASRRAIERNLPTAIRQLVYALGGLGALPIYDPERLRRAAPPAEPNHLIGRARVLEEAARRMREQAVELAPRPAELHADAAREEARESVASAAPAPGA